ncbi:MAG: hypothetical protein EBZ48_17500 [Proteobacteria bacterium]|nr:hypothetical protein [Pseudomonadota bacterium]
MASIDEARQRLESQKLPQELFERMLHELQEVSATDKVRRKVDSELAQEALGRRASVEAEFLKRRSELQSLAIIAAQAASDTRPSTTSLVRWGHAQQVYFDDFYQTVGFYLPPHQGASLIVLRAPFSGQMVQVESLRVFASEDNERWMEVSPQKVATLRVGSNQLVEVSIPLEGQRYWKIHNSSPVRSRQFGGSLSDILSVYGNSARKEDG